ncbi:MAG: FimB/Mfa2 family fimbrial subunit [Alistipes sp.]|nr:FimB/Mfa2 family fimbrial subunit [Alistipes sp.]
MKARFLALAALVLGMASCQNDFDGASVGVGGEVDFQLSVAVPEFGATRADEDGKNGYDSAYGAIDYLSEADWTNVDLRYTLEVYDLDAVNNPDAAPVKDRMTQVVDKYQPVSFELRLVPGRDYRFVVFADFVDANGEGLHHTLGTNLRQITVKDDMISQELTDAYFATLDVEELANNQTGDIELTRPYGKVRVIATDLHELNLNVEAAKTVVTYDACHPGVFNAVTGAIDSVYEQESYEVVYGAEGYSAYTVGYDAMNDVATDRLSHKTLFTDYILAKDTQESIHFTMSVYDEKGGLIKTTNFNTEIPVQRNYLTTVIGNVLTTATEINVTIDDNFKSPDYEVELWDGKTVTPVDEKDGVYEIYEAAELAWIAQAVAGGETFIGKTVKLYKDINLNGERWTPIGLSSQHSSTFRGTFDGNGKAIENLFVDNEQGAGLFGMASPKAIRNLTIKNATIKGTHYAGALAGWIQSVDSQSHNRGVIEGCRVEGANVTLAVANKDNGDKAGALVGYAVRVDITGCEVNNAEVKAYRDVAGLVGHANTTTTVSNNTVKNVIVVADQTAEYIEVKAANAGAVVGRVSTDATIENNTVENVDVRVVVNTAANLQSMIANAEDDKEATIVLGGDINLNDLVTRAAGNNLVIANGKSVVLDLNGYTLSAIDENTSGNFYLIDNRGNLTIKDSKGEGKIALSATTNRNWNASSVVVANNPGGNLVVESGIIEHLGGTDMAYAVDNLTNGKGTYAVTTIEKATIKSTYRAVRQFLNGVEATNELYVKAGAVIDGTNNKSIFFHDPSKNANTGKLVVEQGAQLKGDVYLFVTAGSTEWPVEVSIAASALVDNNEVLSANVPAGYAVELENGVYSVAYYDAVVTTKDDLKNALLNNNSILLGADINYGNDQLALTGKDKVINLNGYTLTTNMAYGGMAIKNGASIKNGHIVHTSTVAAIKAFNVGSIENVTIETTCATADKVITAIAVQQGGYVGAIKNVTINGVSQGIEVGYQATVDLVENTTVDMATNGTANGIGMVINGGKVGLAKDSTFKGAAYGVTMHLKGVFAVGLELENCNVEGATASIYAWDEKGISNTSGSLVLTYDAATTLTGPFVWDFEEECQGVVTLNRPE